MEKEEYLRYASSLDESAFRDLMEDYGQEVWNFAYLLTGKWDVADDIVQDVFLKVLRRIGTYRGESAFKTWLFAITRNTAISYMRQAFFRKVTLVEYVAPRTGHRSAEDEAVERLYADDIWKAVMKLPAKYREVLILDGKYDLTVKEIAKILGQPEGTVKSKLARARAQMAGMAGEEMRYERA